MGVMAKPSQVILLVEDTQHERFICRYLRRVGLKNRAMRIRKSPAGKGSAEQWVREQYASEVSACQRRQAETSLIVVIDADTYTVEQRMRQLDQVLQKAGIHLQSSSDRIARLIPKRNLETWILCLNNVPVNEDEDYSKSYSDWTELISKAAVALYQCTRPTASLPSSCVDSLRLGICQLQNVHL